MEIWQVISLYFAFVMGILFFVVRDITYRKSISHLFPHNWKCPDCGAGPGKKCLEYTWVTHEVFETIWFHSQRFTATDIENERREKVRIERAKRDRR